MSDYLDQLGKDATLHDVFEDLFNVAENLTKDLDRLRTEEAGEGSSNNIVPETPLIFNWGAVVGIEGILGEGDYHTTQIGVLAIRRDTGLYSTSKFIPKSGGIWARAGVNGYRGEELSGDYSVSHKYVDGGRIEVSLDDRAFLLASRHNETEPRGKFSEDPQKLLRHLMAKNYQLLAIVSRGILDDISAAEMIRDGQNPQDIFEMMDKPVSVLSRIR